MIDLIDVNGRLKTWDEISNDYNLGLIEFLEWYGIIQSIPSNWKESILGNPTNREVYNSVSRDGETITINNVAMEVKTIKIRHIYKHLISGKVKKLSFKTHFNKTFDFKQDFSWEKVYMLPYKSTIESRVFSVKFSITFFI